MFSWQIQGLAKVKQFLDLTRNNNGEDLLAQRHGGTPRGIFRDHGLRWQKLTSMCRTRVSINVSEYARQKCVARARPVGAQCARALNRRAAFLFHVDTCIFPRDKTGLTMGKPEVNLTFFFFSMGKCPERNSPNIFAFLLFIHGNFIYGCMAI